MKQLLKIRAKTNKDIGVDLEFKSIAEAKFFNPDLHDFEIVDNKNKIRRGKTNGKRTRL